MANEDATLPKIQVRGVYSQQLGFRQGACERVEGVYMEYMTDDEQACNAAENSSAQSILTVVGFSGRVVFGDEVFTWFF